ncbi:hypothetical protein [Sinorhizobium meliloti]|uniref:hypothetical protein n=1 Tax=Rhizobium meliloti TaxID=382 RepID=UPI000FD70E25|nr:hypothetical protein [Sinorhizobium meliloti]MDW9936589.1 hypothetical protein [Sinorhizobium meliloti]MDX0395834.1 hypothetical protein [Sinorhizobium meliloti]MQX33282.1 hypothetical protein [Sinorhizobium meliloti]RVH68894.1 hypothetical protein CN198_14665 [Sinorhizobium meliloti]RVO60613.1 hypothetical protein CN092_04600 [Sinorhizobium meliloti]
MARGKEAEPNVPTEYVAERFRCSKWTVLQNWRKWGLKATRFGKGYVFSIESVEKVERERFGMESA